jgi:hypothetical protein
LATYTSCFRAYRRAAVSDLQIRNGGFLGVAEMLGRLDLQGGAIVECPAVLDVRLLGRSKMKTLRTIVGHLGLLARLSKARLVSFLGKERINRDPALAGPDSEFEDPVSDPEAENQSSDQRS